MSEALIAPSAYDTLFEEALAAPQPEALRELRERAYARFLELGFPTTRQEEWRFTNVAQVARTSFAPPAAASDLATVSSALVPLRLADACELVFVDGRFVSELSSDFRSIVGVALGSLRDLRDADRRRAAEQLGHHADIAERPFAALSTALFAEAAVVRVERGQRVDVPIHLLFYTSAGSAPTAVFPRVLLLAEEESRVTLVETYAGAASAVYLTAPVTELVVGPAAQVDHYKLQRESRDAFHLALLHVALARQATVSTQTFSLGAAIARHDVQGRLGGEGAEATLNGLYLVDGRQLADFHMRVDHASPHTRSHELFKGVLNDRGRGVFNGRIHVHPQAQKTDAKQTSRNLLLSQEALVNANPQLEIFADDVRCTHGSTVGQLDELAVFYLRSRGIGLEAARSLLTYAFASDLVERVQVPSLHHALQEYLLSWIPQGEVVREAI